MPPGSSPMRRIGLALSLLASSCATGQGNGQARLRECLTDPVAKALWCDGSLVPFSEAYGYVCHSLDDHEAYRARCGR